MSKTEIRYVRGTDVRASVQGNAKILSGYVAKFNTPCTDDGLGFDESIAPGAFARSLREGADVRCLFNHDQNFVLGRTRAKTVVYSEDATGLHFVCTLPNTQVANDLHESVTRGDIDGCSFGFRAIKDTWTEVKQSDGSWRASRVLNDVNLFDGGPVTFPAYDDTSVAARNVSISSEGKIMLALVEKRNAERRELGNSGQSNLPPVVNTNAPVALNDNETPEQKKAREANEAAQAASDAAAAAEAQAKAEDNAILLQKAKAKTAVAKAALKAAKADLASAKAEEVKVTAGIEIKSATTIVPGKIEKRDVSLDDIYSAISSALVAKYGCDTSGWCKAWACEIYPLDGYVIASVREGDERHYEKVSFTLLDPDNDGDIDDVELGAGVNVIEAWVSDDDDVRKGSGVNVEARAKKQMPEADLAKPGEDRGAECRCEHCRSEQDIDCSDPDCDCQNVFADGDDEDIRSARSAGLEIETRADGKVRTKTVAGKKLTKSQFAYVGDPDKTETWKLPIFDAAHVRNALARFNQTEGIPANKKAGVKAKIDAAANKFGIQVSDEKKSATPVVSTPLSQVELDAAFARLLAAGPVE